MMLFRPNNLISVRQTTRRPPKKNSSLAWFWFSGRANGAVSQINYKFIKWREIKLIKFQRAPSFLPSWERELQSTLIKLTHPGSDYSTLLTLTQLCCTFLLPTPRPRTTSDINICPVPFRTFTTASKAGRMRRSGEPHKEQRYTGVFLNSSLEVQNQVENRVKEKL